MSPVNRAGSVFDISSRHSFLYKNFDVFIWQGGMDRAGNFSHMNTLARIPALSVTKHFQLRMACKVADMSERGSTGLLGALDIFPGYWDEKYPKGPPNIRETTFRLVSDLTSHAQLEMFRPGVFTWEKFPTRLTRTQS